MVKDLPATGILVSLALAVFAILPQPVPRRDESVRMGGQEVPGSPTPTDDQAFEDPKSCRNCHPLIYARWSRGMHRYSFEDPIFKAAYSQVYTESSGEAAATCLRCHAPAAHADGDFAVKGDIHPLGVQCDFCHSVESVDLGTPGSPFHLKRGKAMAAPHAGATNKDHEVWHQPLLTSPRFCAGCHEYVVEGGAHLISTYSEWEKSRYAEEGRTCHSCHMPTLQHVAREDGTMREVNDHDLSGGHSSDQIRKAARVAIDSIEREGDSCSVTVTVENIGSGHCLPTGMPSRQVVLEVELSADNKRVGYDYRTYRKVIADEKGTILANDGDIKWRGRAVVSDNRLRPGEARQETFHFRVPLLSPFDVKVTLNYVYSPLLLKPESIHVQMGGEQRYVRRDR